MRYIDTFLSFLFPPRCLNCHRSIAQQNNVLCEECKKKLTIPDTLWCGTCGARLPQRKKICHLNTPFLLGSLTTYEDPFIKKIIHAFKFARVKSVGIFLGHLLSAYFEKLNFSTLEKEKMVVIPIPLSNTRLKERGFNQSAIIAQAFAEKANIVLDETILSRPKHTIPQSHTQNKQEREAHMIDAFAISSPADLSGRTVLLIDDVITTGATLRSAAHTLQTMGAKKIIALTIAR